MKKLWLILVVLVSAFNSCKDEKQEVEKEKVVEITTPYGKMYMWLFKETPLHRNNFLKLASEGFYDSTTFHRIIPGFMIQGETQTAKTTTRTMMAQVVRAILFLLKFCLLCCTKKAPWLLQDSAILLIRKKLPADRSFILR